MTHPIHASAAPPSPVSFGAASPTGKVSPLPEFTIGKAGWRQGPGSVPLFQYAGPREEKDGHTLLDWPAYTMASLGTPLETFGMSICNAVVIVDKEAGLHYMSHISNKITAEALAAHFKQLPLNLDRSSIYLMPGNEAMTEVISQRILDGLAAVKPAIRDKVQFIHFPDQAIRDHAPSLVSYNGNVFYEPKSGLFNLRGDMIPKE